MNFIYFSPHFPRTNEKFCRQLKERGVNVLGIGDAPYESLSEGLKQSLTEYYRVRNPENYDEVYRAAAFFAFKYGKIDWVESNNEYWLGQDARLRSDFNVPTGIHAEDVEKFKNKSAMKAFFKAANIPAPRLAKVTSYDETLAFIHEVGYPVIVKPDNGVGACNTWRLNNDSEFDYFFSTKPPVPYVTEEFIDGDIVSYDAITDSHAHPLFESMTEWPPSIADIVTKELDLAYYVAAGVPEKLRRLGRTAARTFGAARRFIHLEFFRLKKPRNGLGNVGDYVALEVNMRPAGGDTPDMMNYAHATDVYRIWADMVAMDGRSLPASGQDHFCVYAGRRDKYAYRHSHDEIMQRYGASMAQTGENPPMSWPQMGNRFYMVHAPDEAAAREFIAFVQERI
ncbi:MAG: ATP-grasp domain-containing protein [Kiritimatiellae bacterium]|nr:ATP-grasp domain-containing protein [Kiritimatiellia bacterium]